MLEYSPKTDWIRYRIRNIGIRGYHNIGRDWLYGKIKSDKSAIYSASFAQEYRIRYREDRILDEKGPWCFLVNEGTSIQEEYGIVDEVLALADYVAVENLLTGKYDKSTKRKRKVIRNS